MEEQVQKRMQALSAEIAILRTKLTTAKARITEDGVIIQNLYLEIDRLRECFKNSSQATLEEK